MNTISKTPTHRPLKVRKKLIIAAGCFLLFSCSGCLALPKDSSPSTASVPAPSAPPTLPQPTAGRAADKETDITVVGIKPGQDLPLFQSPSRDSEIIGRIPPAGKSIHLLLGSSFDTEDVWVEVEYQDQQGWAEKSHLALQQGNLPDQLALLGQSVSAALKEADYTSLKELIHPQLCLRFAPYQYLRDSDQVFCRQELEKALHSNESLVWGNYDGTGEPIQLTFQEYHNNFVYDEDFFQPEIVGFNQEVSQGNAINNIQEIYPESVMVEYYFSGFDPQYGGMDWRSLRLVFFNQEGRWYLVALVHGEWTI